MWQGRSRADLEVGDLLLVELVDDRAPHVELHEPGPAGIRGELVAVLVGLEPDDTRLEAERQVLGDHDHLASLAPEAQGHGEDAVVVGRRGERLGQRLELLVVQLDPERAAFVVDRHGLEQRPVAGAQVLEEAEALAGGPAQLGVVALALQLGEDHEREHDLVLGEARDRQGIGEQNGGVDDVDGPRDQGTGDASPRREARRAPSRHGPGTRCSRGSQVRCLGCSEQSTPPAEVHARGPRPHRRDHRRRQQGRHDVVVRVALHAPRRRAVVDQGDALLPPRSLREATAPGGRVGRVLRRRRRPPRAPRGDAVVLLRRRRRRRGDARRAWSIRTHWWCCASP